MKTPPLLTVPKDSPSLRARLTAFKNANGIETHNSGGTDDGRWLAAHLPSCRKLGYGVTEKSSLIDCSCKVGRLMDEAGYTAYGPGELSAIRKLCEQITIPCDL